MQTQSNINANTIAQLLAGTAGATFAQIVYTTVVATAAAHKHKQNNKHYLFCIYNNAQSTYTIDGVAATKQEVAALLTASASAKLLNPSSTTYNKTNNIEHNVVVRTIALANILQITANKQTLVA